MKGTHCEHKEETLGVSFSHCKILCKYKLK